MSFANTFCVAVFFALGASACSRQSSERSSEAQSSSAVASVVIAPQPSTPPPRPLVPPATPVTPPQLVACGERDFYRITQSALEVFQTAAKPPPPHIRGSSVAERTTRIALAGPSNVVWLGKKTVLVTAKDGSFRYQHGQAEAQRHAPLGVSGAFQVWPDPRRAGTFYVRASRDKAIQEFGFAALASAAGGAPAEPKPASRTIALPEFDERLFTPLADGSALYSTAKGLLRVGQESRPLPSPELAEPPTLLFADASAQRYWAASAGGKLGSFNVGPSGKAVFAGSIPGVVIDAASDGKHVAVLSIALAGQDYQPTVTVFSNGERKAEVPLGPSPATVTQPELDLCLLRGRPWLVVGNRYWAQLLDWESRRLLAEW